MDTLHRNYNNEKQDILSGRAEKYKSISTSTKDNLLGKGRRLTKKWEAQKKKFWQERGQKEAMQDN